MSKIYKPFCPPGAYILAGIGSSHYSMRWALFFDLTRKTWIFITSFYCNAFHFSGLWDTSTIFLHYFYMLLQSSKLLLHRSLSTIFLQSTQKSSYGILERVTLLDFQPGDHISAFSLMWSCNLQEKFYSLFKEVYLCFLKNINIHLNSII